jgi:hypothetical protein
MKFRVPRGYISNNTTAWSIEMHSALGFEEIDGDYCFRIRLNAKPDYVAFEVISADHADDVRGCAVYLQGRATVGGETRAVSDWVECGSRYVSEAWLDVHLLAARALRHNEAKKSLVDKSASAVASSSSSTLASTSAAVATAPIHDISNKEYATALNNALTDGYQSRIAWGKTLVGGPILGAPSCKECKIVGKRFAVPLSLVPSPLREYRTQLNQWRAWLKIVPEHASPFHCAVVRKDATPSPKDFGIHGLSGISAQKLLKDTSKVRGNKAPEVMSEYRTAEPRARRRLPSLLEGTFTGSYKPRIGTRFAGKESVIATRLATAIETKEVEKVIWHLDCNAKCLRYRAVGSDEWFNVKNKEAALLMLEDVREMEKELGISAVRPEVTNTAGPSAERERPEVTNTADPSAAALNCSNDKAIEVAEGDDEPVITAVRYINRHAPTVNDDDSSSENEPILANRRRLKRRVIDIDDESGDEQPVRPKRTCRE